MGGAFRKAITLRDQVKVSAIPKGAWFYNREPAFSVRGPSAPGSWLEPLALQLNYRIQIATAALLNPDFHAPLWVVTCEEQEEIVRETCDSVGVKAPKISVVSDRYYAQVLARAKKLVETVEDPDRIFEVGMRAVTCMDQHRIALRAIKEAGIRRTSNALLARELDMIPVGTMGHEHIQRISAMNPKDGDYAAFVTMRDRHPGFVFYLPDTFDTIGSGIPAAVRAMREAPEREGGIRFDSEHGIRGHYLYAVTRLREAGLEKTLALESGWNLKLTEEFEDLRKQVGWPTNKQCYGYGGYLVNFDGFDDAYAGPRRDDVAAVYKLCKSGPHPTMKLGDEPGHGKESIPGNPVVYRTNSPDDHPGYIVQEGEDFNSYNAYRLTDAKIGATSRTPPDRRRKDLAYSVDTTWLQHLCRNRLIKDEL